MKPILFNTEMVRAILEGRKTVTRRAIKNKDTINGWDCEEDGTPIAFIDQWTGDSYPPTYPCPYQSGDILYVRETWGYDKNNWIYKANFTNAELERIACVTRWHPSIHMPKKVARLFLRVTDVRVERLQDIGDCTREGVPRGTHATAHMNDFDERCDFKYLWDSTIKPADRDRYGWDANPWVWVVEFERISREAAKED